MIPWQWINQKKSPHLWKAFKLGWDQAMAHMATDQTDLIRRAAELLRPMHSGLYYGEGGEPWVKWNRERDQWLKDMEGK